MSETKPREIPAATAPKHLRGLARGDQAHWKEDVDYAIALGLDKPSDPADGFGWRVPDQEFWVEWRRNKEAMKAAGYRVRRGDDGQWLVSFTPVKKLPPGEARGARDLQHWSHWRSIARGKGR